MLAASLNLALFAPIGPLSPDQKLTAAAGVSAFLLLLLTWLSRGRVIKGLRTQLAEKEAAHTVTVTGLQAQLASQAADFQQRMDEALAGQMVLDQRFATHREASFKREAEARIRIATLEADLSSSKEMSTQLPPTQARIGDLEGALGAERGRVAALEQAVAATSRRAEDLETHLRDAEQRFAAHQEQAAQRQAEMETQLAANERTLAGDLLRLASADSEVIKLKEAHETYRQQAELRISNLQRGVSPGPGENKIILVRHDGPTNGAAGPTQNP